MLFVLVLVLFVNSVAYSYPSLDPPVRPPIDGSKFAFIRAPYVNTVKVQKKNNVVLQDDVSLRWPNGVVRYYIDEQSYDKFFGAEIKSAIEIIRSSSCIEFEQWKNSSLGHMTWIHITNPKQERECNHEPRFMDSGEVELVFGYDCLNTNQILHTLLHGIGIKDEVTHPHRDKYIRVLWDNIQPAKQHLYRKQAEKPSQTLVEYDPLSVMQFYDRSFSRNGHATIAPLEPGLVISPSKTLSQLDEMRLQMYFGHECNKRKVSDLLNTCKKSLKKGTGGGQQSEKQNINSYDVDGAKNKNVEAADTENLSTQKEASKTEDEGETYAEKQESEAQDETGHDTDEKGLDAVEVAEKGPKGLAEETDRESTNVEAGEDAEGKSADNDYQQDQRLNEHTEEVAENVAEELAGETDRESTNVEAGEAAEGNSAADNAYQQDQGLDEHTEEVAENVAEELAGETDRESTNVEAGEAAEGNSAADNAYQQDQGLDEHTEEVAENVAEELAGETDRESTNVEAAEAAEGKSAADYAYQQDQGLDEHTEEVAENVAEELAGETDRESTNVETGEAAEGKSAADNAYQQDQGLDEHTEEVAEKLAGETYRESTNVKKTLAYVEKTTKCTYKPSEEPGKDIKENASQKNIVKHEEQTEKYSTLGDPFY